MIGETKTIIGRIYAYELNGESLQFVRDMYNCDSEEFQRLADIIETQIANTLASIDDEVKVSVSRLFPTEDGGVGVVFETSVAAASSADRSDVDTLIAASITPDGYLGTSGLSVTRSLGNKRKQPRTGGPGQYARTIDGIFYASNGEEFDPSLLDTNSPEFLQFASEVEPPLTAILDTLEGFQSVRVTGVSQIGDLIGVEYEVTVASTSPATVNDVNEVFARLAGFLGNTGLMPLSIGDSCPSNLCTNGGVCTVQADYTFNCICDAGVIGSQCQLINATINTENGITTKGWIGIGFGIGLLALSTILCALCCMHFRLSRVRIKSSIPYVIGEPTIPSYVAVDADPIQLNLLPPLDNFAQPTGQLTPAFPSLLNMANSPIDDVYFHRRL
ncbi:uncharacterized protein [Amphiura filiformis]|uniref:uncharacterized protein n=1 Tax=Amphiura filiformis TaxID=82378 RepID=UPI003B21BFA6